MGKIQIQIELEPMLYWTDGAAKEHMQKEYLKFRSEIENMTFIEEAKQRELEIYEYSKAT